MSTEPIIAIYNSYLRPTLLEVYCFRCHRLIGASPKPALADLVRRTHVCEV
jgi:hypothetical protein